jgi:hypothetical protein
VVAPPSSPGASVAVDGDEATDRPRLDWPGTRPARFLFVVAPTRVDLFLRMRRRFLDDDAVLVLLDRRTQGRRVKQGAGPVPDRRRQSDRRAPTDYWESTAYHPAVLIPITHRSYAGAIDRFASSPSADKEPTMEPARVNAARVLAWVREGRELLEGVLPAVLDEREALQRERDEAIRRYHELQAENEALRAEVAQATAALRQLEQGQAEIAGSVGQFVTQMTRALEPMRTLGEKLGPRP